MVYIVRSRYYSNTSNPHLQLKCSGADIPQAGLGEAVSWDTSTTRSICLWVTLHSIVIHLNFLLSTCNTTPQTGCLVQTIGKSECDIVMQKLGKKTDIFIFKFLFQLLPVQ